MAVITSYLEGKKPRNLRPAPENCPEAQVKKGQEGGGAILLKRKIKKKTLAGAPILTKKKMKDLRSGHRLA